MKLRSGSYGHVPVNARRRRPRAMAGAVAALTLSLCCAALALSSIEPDLLAPVRAAVSSAVTPIASELSQAAGIALQPVRQLLAWATGTPPAHDAAADARTTALETRVSALERENRDLKALTGFAEAAKLPMVSARVIMRSSSPLSHTVVLDAGTEQGVHEGEPVVAGGGLIGRVIQAYPDQASAMLLTDRLSRVPVQVGADEVRAVLVGSGDAGARLEFLVPGATIRTGDIVTTSGIGGMFPRGLHVGVVGRVGDAPEIRLSAGDADPLVVGVLAVDGPAYEAVTRVSTRAQKTVAQSPDARPEVRDKGSAKDEKRRREVGND